MKKIEKVVKRQALNALTFPLLTKGYTKNRAKDWVREYVRDLRRGEDATLFQKQWAHKHGFTINQVKSLGITENNYHEFISYRDYKYIQPVSGKYSKWIDDKITIKNIFKPFDAYLPECYYQISSRDGETQIIPLQDCPENYNDTIEDILKLIKEKKKVIYCAAGKERSYVVSYAKNKFFINGLESDYERFVNFIMEINIGKDTIRMICEYIPSPKEFKFEKGEEAAVLKLYVINSEGDNPRIGDAFLSVKAKEAETEAKTVKWTPVDLADGSYVYDSAAGEHKQGTIPYLEEIEEKVKEVCLFVPQIEYMGITVVFTENGFKFQWFNPNPPYLKNQHFSAETVAFLQQKVGEKKEAFNSLKVQVEEGWDRVFRSTRKQFTKAFFPKGMLPYLGPRWIYNVGNDFITNKEAKVGEKIWAYKNGFLSYRLNQYGITEETIENYISDFEYMWMRHINPRYKEWFEDKITIKYILSDFKECFPAYYYHITVKNGKNKIIPMMDCPENYNGTYEDIFKLAQAKKVLALKPDEGSHGEGFYKLSYEDGKYFLNAEEVTEQRIIELLEDVNNQYLITEYIQMHPELKKIYPNSVNTIRLTVWKKDGKNPYLGNGYMRFGSSKTGVVDNVGAGGIGVDLDVKTGHFYNATTIQNNSTLVPCPIHPDTGEKIEGYIPHWDYVRDTILKIAASVPQVEYLGFDVAVTEDGIKFPEINRFPDYPRINPLTPETMDYLLMKLEKKKELFDYLDKQPPRVFKLPKRNFK